MSQQGLTHRNLWKWLIKHFILRSKIDIKPKKVHMYVSMYTYTHIHAMRIKNTQARVWGQPPPVKSYVHIPSPLTQNTSTKEKEGSCNITAGSVDYSDLPKLPNTDWTDSQRSQTPSQPVIKSRGMWKSAKKLSFSYVYLIVSIDGHGHFPGFQTYNWKEYTQQLAELSRCSLNIKSEPLL